MSVLTALPADPQAVADEVWHNRFVLRWKRMADELPPPRETVLIAEGRPGYWTYSLAFVDEMDDEWYAVDDPTWRGRGRPLRELRGDVHWARVGGP